MEERLKVCPFCGCKASLRLWNDIAGYTIANKAMVLCVECGLNGPVIFGENIEERAIRAWNTRHVPSVGEIEKIIENNIWSITATVINPHKCAKAIVEYLKEGNNEQRD